MPRADAHIHAPELAQRDPGFPERFRAGGYRACSAAHSGPELDAARALLDSGLDLRLSFGIHPQWTVWTWADRLAEEAREGRIDAVGEAGFDFFGDRPERVRNPENLAAQRSAFEYQLGLAERYGLPLVLHVRRALDLVFEYAPRLKRIPAALLHSWSGPLAEARSLLAKGVPAYFSFGAPVLNGNRKARESCALLPADRVLLETDAPWQPPRGAEFCTLEHLALVRDEAARLRGISPEAMEESAARAFETVFGNRSTEG